MPSIAGARYFVFGEPADMCKSFYGLCGLVMNRLGQDPINGDVFIFINWSSNRLHELHPGYRQ
ncbi:MAG TPA: IS66 family insertion sequence element accessory protein TnpB [Bacteroidales bacterium]|nr:IS66 family insertion sequence element accessory protein TnpB [Bacteroidales bacterium]